MGSKRIIDLFEDTISGEKVVDYLLSIGTSGGFYDHTLKDVHEREFELMEVNVDDLKRSDEDFSLWLSSQDKARFEDGKYSPSDLRKLNRGESLKPESRADSPIVIVDGKVRDGWHRIAGAFFRGKTTLKAYVAH